MQMQMFWDPILSSARTRRLPPPPPPPTVTDAILFQNTSTGQATIWDIAVNALVGGGPVSPNPGPEWKAIGTGDFNNDGRPDILWQNQSTGQVSALKINEGSLTQLDRRRACEPRSRPGLEGDWDRPFQRRRSFRHSLSKRDHGPSLDLGNEREQFDRRRPGQPQSGTSLESDWNGRFQ